MITPAGLADIARYADAIGVEKSLVQPIAAGGALGPPTSLVADAHRAGLLVHVWTLRSDPAFLPKGYAGDAAAEWRRFAALGVDGMFGDFPDVGVAALAR
jgi:glycerophosphoryl diester phosphodiesterase